MNSKLAKLCKICTGWNHDSSDCKDTFVCKKCGGPNIRKACALQSFSNFASIGSESVKLCIQEVDISCYTKGNKTVRVLFDKGSQSTLIREKFGEAIGWSYTKASYSLAGNGSN